MTLELLKSKTGRTLIESHRGVEGDVPENSWSAIKLGHELGADLIEVDVQMSRDGAHFCTIITNCPMDVGVMMWLGMN